MREAAIASRIRPWIGEWLASDQTDTGGASPPAPKAAASAGLASQTSATFPIGRDISAGCATGPAAKAMSVRPVSNCWFRRSEEHTSEIQSLLRISYAVLCLQKHSHNN